MSVLTTLQLPSTVFQLHHPTRQLSGQPGHLLGIKVCSNWSLRQRLNLLELQPGG